MEEPQPGDHLGPREREGRPVRQVARARDWSISRNRYFGLRRSRWKRATTPTTRAWTYGLPDDASSATFGVRPEAPALSLHRRAHTAEPRRPDRARRCAASPTSSTSGSDLAPCRSAGALPVRERGLVRLRTTPPTSSSSTSGRRAAGSTTLHVLDRALRPSAFRNVVSHGIVLGNDGQKMSKSLRTTSRRRRGLRPRRIRRDALVPDVEPVLRGGNLVVTEDVIREGVRARCCCRSEHLVLLRFTPTPSGE